MSKKHLTYDDRLAIQARLQRGLKVARIAKELGKDRATIWRKSKARRRLVGYLKRKQLCPSQHPHKIPVQFEK